MGSEEGDAGRGAADLVVEVDPVAAAPVGEIREEVEPGSVSDPVMVFPVGHHADFVTLLTRRANVLGHPRSLGF